MQSPREEGKRGPGGVFVTPTEVELSKTVHVCRATSTVEYASMKLLHDVPFLQAEPDIFTPLRVWQERSLALSSLPPPPCLQPLALPERYLSFTLTQIKG